MKNIEWADVTWNPVTGCSRNCKWAAPDGTTVGCYARAINDRFHHQPDFSVPVFHEERLDQPSRWKKPRRIFVCSMGDLYAPEVPTAWIDAVLHVIENNPQHTFLLLTKCPRRLCVFNYPSNAWVGLSVWHAEFWGQPATIPARNRWISFEPLVQDVCGLMFRGELHCHCDWVVIGALSAGAKKYQPERKWIENILRAADGLPVFMKDNLDCKALGIKQRTELP